MFVDLQTSRVRLRQLCRDDAPRIFQYRTHPLVSRFQSWGTDSPQAIETYLEQLSATAPDAAGIWHQMGITLQADGRLIGDCGFRVSETDSRQAEIGIALAPDFQGQGFAGDALRALLGHLFVGLAKHRVWGSVDPNNFPSIRLLQRAGMRQEAHFVKSLWSRGEWVDDLIFAILASEWSARQAALSS